MASFVASFLSGAKDKAASHLPRPKTPGADHDFVNPAATPQGSPSKKTVVPGANDLQNAFESGLRLDPSVLDSPIKLGRPQSVITPLSPGKTNIQPMEDGTASVDDSVVHKSGPAPGGLLKSTGQENTPPPRLGGTESPHNHNHAALNRHELYQSSRPLTPAKKFNTSRGLTPEELEILQKPNVKRMVNVTQLCMTAPQCSYSGGGSR
jgi:cell cycle protein kinase DBF2